MSNENVDNKVRFCFFNKKILGPDTMNVFQMERKMDDNAHGELSGFVSIDDTSMVKECASDGVLCSKESEAEEIETEDAKFLDLIQIRNHLKSLKFGWMKYSTFKSAKFLPGFVCSAEADGTCQAQSVKADGDVTGKTNTGFEFSENVDDDLKDKAAKLALKKFNKKFYFSYE